MVSLLRLTAIAMILAGGHASAANEPLIGLITKTESNPFFVKMKEGAAETAKALGARLMTGAGKRDCDKAGQVTTSENLPLQAPESF